jgi:hypothetical protein
MTERIHLTEELALKHMRKAVAEYGSDYVYQSYNGSTCLYVFGDKPSCLVGQVLVRAGVPVEAFTPFANSNRIGAVVEDLPVDISSPLVAALAVAQDVQDNGRTWGEALWRFETVLGVEPSGGGTLMTEGAMWQRVVSAASRPSQGTG